MGFAKPIAYVRCILIFVAFMSSVEITSGEGFCAKIFKNGKWESHGDCGSQQTSSVLAKLDVKLTGDQESVCYMGIRSNEILNSAITASSEHNAASAAHFGRLDMQPYGGSLNEGCWRPAANNISEWIQVDFGKLVDIAGVVTQGRPKYYNDFVKTYKVACGMREGQLQFVKQNGSDKIFQGNDKDKNFETKVYNKMPKILKCRYIRLYPQLYRRNMAMRIELVAGKCFDIFSL